MDKKTIITLVVCLLAVGGTVYFLFFRTINTKADNGISDKGIPGTTPAKKTDYPTFPLELGDRCDEVGKLQTKMNQWMSYNNPNSGAELLMVDRKFGNKTLLFVRMIFNTDTVTQAQYDWLMASSFPGALSKPNWQIF